METQREAVERSRKGQWKVKEVQWKGQLERSRKGSGKVKERAMEGRGRAVEGQGRAVTYGAGCPPVFADRRARPRADAWVRWQLCLVRPSELAPAPAATA